MFTIKTQMPIDWSYTARKFAIEDNFLRMLLKGRKINEGQERLCRTE